MSNSRTRSITSYSYTGVGYAPPSIPRASSSALAAASAAGLSAKSNPTARRASSIGSLDAAYRAHLSSPASRTPHTPASPASPSSIRSSASSASSASASSRQPRPSRTMSLTQQSLARISSNPFYRKRVVNPQQKQERSFAASGGSLIGPGTRLPRSASTSHLPSVSANGKSGNSSGKQAEGPVRTKTIKKWVPSSTGLKQIEVEVPDEPSVEIPKAKSAQKLKPNAKPNSKPKSKPKPKPKPQNSDILPDIMEVMDDSEPSERAEPQISKKPIKSVNSEKLNQPQIKKKLTQLQKPQTQPSASNPATSGSASASAPASAGDSGSSTTSTLVELSAPAPQKQSAAPATPANPANPAAASPAIVVAPPDPASPTPRLTSSRVPRPRASSPAGTPRSSFLRPGRSTDDEAEEDEAASPAGHVSLAKQLRSAGYVAYGTDAPPQLATPPSHDAKPRKSALRNSRRLSASDFSDSSYCSGDEAAGLLSVASGDETPLTRVKSPKKVNIVVPPGSEVKRTPSRIEKGRLVHPKVVQTERRSEIETFKRLSLRDPPSQLHPPPAPVFRMGSPGPRVSPSIPLTTQSNGFAGRGLRQSSAEPQLATNAAGAAISSKFVSRFADSDSDEEIVAPSSRKVRETQPRIVSAGFVEEKKKKKRFAGLKKIFGKK